MEISRRSFLQSTAGLVVAFYLPTPLRRAFAQDEKPTGAPNAFIQIAPDETITITINKLEMGQGVNTSMAQLIAEELECDWTKIRSVSAPVNAVYNHTVFGTQMTGGSSALSSSWDQHRLIGASMREMLKAAAAARWGVAVEQVRAENGFVVHPTKGKLSYGALAEAANKLPIPKNPTLKSPDQFKVIGKSMRRVDGIDKSNGVAIYGIDVKIPGMLYCMVLRPPTPNAKITSFDDKATRKISGVVDVVQFYGGRVAVLAKNTHAARVGRDALNLKWDRTTDTFSGDSLMADFKVQAKSAGVPALQKGDARAQIAKSKRKLEAEYEFPFLAHAAMEPMNCTIRYDGKSAEIWSGHQMPTVDRDSAAKILGLAPEKVKVNTVYAGGSFGRRANKVSDYVVEAAELAKIVKKPLKIVWSREDDMRGGYYRPLTYHRVSIGLDAKKIGGWDHRIVGQSVIGGSFFEQMMVKDGLEATITEGVSDTRYEVANFRCEQTRASTPITTLWWRSVGHTHTAYVMETMMDEVAVALKQDQLAMRRELLAKHPRHVAVIDLLREKTGWGKKKPPKGRAWGVAVHESFDSVVGQLAEVSMVNGMPKVHRVWSAVHCGQVVNPEVAKSQVEGGILFGLSAALYGEVKIKDGEVLSGNFVDSPVARMNEAPVVETYFVESKDKPTGLGEPGVPPIAPAVANAVFQLTKKRLRKLPFSKELQA